MNEFLRRRTVVIVNPQGLHARPADMFTRLAGQYESRIVVAKENLRVDGKSILELLTLAAEAGTELTIEATGRYADEALDRLAALVATGVEGEGAEAPQEEQN